MEILLWVGLGGFLGAILRYLVSNWAGTQFGTTFPWGTLLINVTGSCFLAFFLAWAANHSGLDPRLRLLVATGFVGAYTTFSTYAYETIVLLHGKDLVRMVGNVFGTNFLCLVGSLIGWWIGSRS